VPSGARFFFILEAGQWPDPPAPPEPPAPPDPPEPEPPDPAPPEPAPPEPAPPAPEPLEPELPDPLDPVPLELPVPALPLPDDAPLPEDAPVPDAPDAPLAPLEPFSLVPLFAPFVPFELEPLLFVPFVAFVVVVLLTFSGGATAGSGAPAVVPFDCASPPFTLLLSPAFDDVPPPVPNAWPLASVSPEPFEAPGPTFCVELTVGGIGLPVPLCHAANETAVRTTTMLTAYRAVRCG